MPVAPRNARAVRIRALPLLRHLAATAALASVLPGCTPALKNFSPSNIWHNMQPHRLQRLNRGRGMSTDAYNFSVSDQVPSPRFFPSPLAGEGPGVRGQNDSQPEGARTSASR